MISSLSHSVVFLYFFALIAEEGFRISSCYSLELCIQMLVSFLFSFAFHFSSFHSCWRRNETPTLQSGLNLYILTLASYSCFILYPLHNNLQGKLPSTMIQRLYSAQGEITFTLTYLLQLRLCFGELPYQLRIHFVPGSVPFEESEKHPCVQEMFFSHGNKQRILS